MDRLVYDLLDQRISKSTHSVYQSGWRQYVKFCRDHGHPPLPLSEHILCQFAAVMSQSITWKTLRSYLSALRFFQIHANLPDSSLSSFPRLTYILRGIHKITPDHQRKHRLPITMDLLSVIKARIRQLRAAPPE